MRNVFKTGDKKEYRRTVRDTDLAVFHGEQVHPVCSTFSLARDFEYSSRQFVLEMKDETEEGVGTFLTIEHKGPAWEGEEIVFTATVVKLQGQELTCSVMASVGKRTIAKGATGQKIIKKENLREIFRKL
jgi:fluoroacetyl-CoA thioesterase